MICTMTMQSVKTQDKVERILLAARKLIATKGYEETTIEAIADEAKVSRGLLHYYFRDKEELISKVVEVAGGDLLARLEEAFKGNSSAELADNIVRLLREFITKQPYLHRLALELSVQAERSKKVRKELIELKTNACKRLYENIENAKKAGVIREDVSTGGLVAFLVALEEGYVSLRIGSDNIFDEGVHPEIWETAKKALLNLIKK